MDLGLYLILLSSIYLFYELIIRPYKIKQLHLKTDEAVNTIVERLKEDRKENQLMLSGAIPTNEDIALYYKMYLKKWELDHVDTWDVTDPMTFENFKKQAMELKYKFLVGMTSDMFIGSPFGNMEMIKIRNYRALIKTDEENNNV